jgi:peptidyl-prolyl cis-trans isomerase SurA
MFLRRTLRLSLVSFCLIFSLLKLPAARAELQPLDRIVAVVDDSVILQSELDRGIQLADQQIKQRNIAPPPEDVVRTQVLERLILTRIQTHRAQEAGIKIDDRELNGIIENVAAQNQLTVPQFIEELKGEGMDYQTVREEIRDQALVQRVRQKEVGSRVVVSDEDIALYLSSQASADDTEYRLSHILVAVPDGANSEQREKARARADALLKRLRAGESFAQLAIANSDGQQALQGGDLDWRKGGNLPTIFASVVPKMAIGDISNVIEGSNGYNIIKLVDKRSSGGRQMVEETKARHILLQPNALRDETATKELINELYERLKKGEDFATLAKKYSDDPGSKNSGGDLGWQPSGVFAPEFQKQLDALAPNAMSAPFHTQFGWHIAQVLERRSRDTTDETRRSRARQAITQRKENEEYDAWLRRLREEAYIEYRSADGSSEADKNGSEKTDKSAATPKKS